MADRKSLKHIDLASMTIMGTSINFLCSAILAIILLIFVNTGTISLYTIILLLFMVFTVLILSISDYFGRTFLFNFLISKLKEIELEIVDMKKIMNISVFPLATICSLISLIITAILYPGIAIGMSLASFLLQIFAFQGGILLFYLIMFLSDPLIIVYSFIFTFISVFIATNVFNLISPKIDGLQLKLSQEGDMTKIDSINYLNLAIMLGVINATLGLVIGLILSFITMNLVATLSLIIYLFLGGFGVGFIVGALIAILYNFLAPKIGELKIKLEPQSKITNSDKKKIQENEETIEEEIQEDKTSNEEPEEKEDLNQETQEDKTSNEEPEEKEDLNQETQEDKTSNEESEEKETHKKEVQEKDT